MHSWLLIYKGSFTVLVSRSSVLTEKYGLLEAEPLRLARPFIPGPLIEY